MRARRCMRVSMGIIVYIAGFTCIMMRCTIYCNYDQDVLILSLCIDCVVFIYIYMYI